MLPPDNILLPASQSKDSESTVAASEAISADTDTDTSLMVADNFASENSGSQTGVSIQLAFDNVGDNSTDA